MHHTSHHVVLSPLHFECQCRETRQGGYRSDHSGLAASEAFRCAVTARRGLASPRAPAEHHIPSWESSMTAQSDSASVDVALNRDSPELYRQFIASVVDYAIYGL